MSELLYDSELGDYIGSEEYRLKRFEKRLVKKLRKSLDDIIPLIVEYLVNNYELEGKLDITSGKVVIRFVKKQ